MKRFIPSSFFLTKTLVFTGSFLIAGAGIFILDVDNHPDHPLAIQSCQAEGAGCPCKPAPYPPGKPGMIERAIDAAICPTCIPIREAYSLGGFAEQLVNKALEKIGGGGGGGGGGSGAGSIPDYPPPTSYTGDEALADLYNNLGDLPTTTTGSTGSDVFDFFAPNGTKPDDDTFNPDGSSGTNDTTDNDTDSKADVKPGLPAQSYFCPDGDCSTLDAATDKQETDETKTTDNDEVDTKSDAATYKNDTIADRLLEAQKNSPADKTTTGQTSTTDKPQSSDTSERVDVRTASNDTARVTIFSPAGSIAGQAEGQTFTTSLDTISKLLAPGSSNQIIVGEDGLSNFDLATRNRLTPEQLAERQRAVESALGDGQTIIEVETDDGTFYYTGSSAYDAFNWAPANNSSNIDVGSLLQTLASWLRVFPAPVIILEPYVF